MASRSSAPSPADEPFIEYLHERAGSNLVAVLRYSTETATVEYTNDDYDEYITAHQERIVSRHRVSKDHLQPTAALDAGPQEAVVRIYEKLVTIDYPHPSAQGIIAVFRPCVAEKLRTFINNSKTYLESPP